MKATKIRFSPFSRLLNLASKRISFAAGRQVIVRLCVCVISLTVAWSVSAESSDPRDVFEQRPNSHIEASEVVSIQLNAMQIYHQDPLLSMETVFSFASPKNRAQTGPLERFSEMIARGYPSLLNHQHANLVSTVVSGDRAMQPVIVTDKQGGQLLYVFLLSQQDCGLEGSERCWMTDSVSLRGKASPEAVPKTTPKAAPKTTPKATPKKPPNDHPAESANNGVRI